MKMLSETKILAVQEKYQGLSAKQKEIFVGYGLRQVKHFVEINLPRIEAALPENSYVQGINADGKLQAFNAELNKSYIWISDLQWQERPVAKMNIDSKEDFLEIWQIFDLQDYALIDLSHIHRDLLEQ